jgi:tRNA(adenine34) deaminase
MTDDPFVAFVVCGDKIVGNGDCGKMISPGGHPEIIAIKEAVDTLGRLDLSDCTLYTNFEPCAACAGVIRDFNIGRVVWSVSSPHIGGESRFGILSADIETVFTAVYCVDGAVAKPPVLVRELLQEEGCKVFDRLGWRMHKR